MRSVTIHVFGPGEEIPRDALVLSDAVGVMVQDRGLRGSEFYDFRFSAPVEEHVIEEVTQLINDLIHNHIAQLGGLQPALF